MRSFIIFQTAFLAFQHMKCKGIAQTVLNGIAAIEERASERRITLNDDEMRTAFLTLAGIWSRAKYYD
ncbi:MAG: hypothetical protein IKO85_05080 [Bacteroidaceae bacterium]|nr:hypothetical protein [Bacteroidaceae bacterium]